MAFNCPVINALHKFIRIDVLHNKHVIKLCVITVGLFKTTHVVLCCFSL